MPLFLGSIGWGEILIIIAAILLIVGGKKIPELMGGIGKGVRNFKEGIRGEGEDTPGDKKQEDGK